MSSPGKSNFFSYLKSLLSQKVPAPATDPNEYIPSYWEDDYCQVEIVPIENRDFIRRQIQQINVFSEK